MKKLIKWITNGSKISKILTHIYRGLFVATKSLNSAISALTEVSPEINPKIIDTLKVIDEYLATATKAVESILGWLAIDTSLDVSTLLSSDSELKTTDEGRAGSLLSSNDTLSEIRTKLKELL